MQIFGDISIRLRLDGKSSPFGWLIALVFFVVILIIYVFSIKFTLLQDDGLFQYRAWNWAEYLIGACALAVIAARFRNITLRSVICGFVLAFVCWASFIARTSDDVTPIIDGAVTLLAYVAGCSLIRFSWFMDQQFTWRSLHAFIDKPAVRTPYGLHTVPKKFGIGYRLPLVHRRPEILRRLLNGIRPAFRSGAFF